MKLKSRNIIFASSLMISLSQAAVITWSGATSSALETATNWTGGTLPSAATPDTATWNGTATGALSLTYGTGLGGAAGNLGLNLNLTATQTSTVNIDSATNTAIRLNNVTLDAGSGAFTLGDGTGTGATGFAITLGGATGQIHTWTNNSSNTAIINSDVAFGLGGAGSHALLFTGSGNWNAKDSLTPSNAANLSIYKTGAGTLTLEGGGALKSGVVAYGGTFASVFKEGVTNMLTGAYSFNTQELVIGGLDPVGTNTQLNLGSASTSSTITGVSWLSVGRGNGVGTTSSDVTLNNASSITSTDFSGGFNAGNAATSVKAIITLNNTSTLSVANNVQIAESPNSNVTVNLNGTSVFSQTANAASTRLGMNNGAVGTLNVNGGTGNFHRDLILGSGGTGQGTINLASGIVNAATTVERWLIMGSATGANGGTINVSGGSLNLNTNTDIRMSQNAGNTGPNTVNLNSGSITGYIGNATGGFSTTSFIDLNYAATGAAVNTFNLNGGTLTTAGVMTTNDGGTASFHFNGGTLKGTVTSTTFLALGGATQYAKVRNGGAIIDTNGFDLGIPQALLHSDISGDNAIDGGVTKNGAGSLTLSGANTFTGNVVVNAGTLKVSGTSLPASATVASGALLDANVTANNSDVYSIPSLNLSGGGSVALELSSGINDQVTVTNASGLDITGGKVTLYAPGTTNPASDSGGPYTLFNYSGTLTGSVSSMSVANPYTGYNYAFNDTGSAITVTITFTDSDGDGMPDIWETANGLNPAIDDSAGNPDGDFSTNLEEFLGNTNPNLASSDPNNTDNDGILDSWEMSTFGNKTTATATSDYDGDLATDKEEFLVEFNSSGAVVSNPKSANTADSTSFPDSDADGINDAWETKYFGGIAAKDGTVDTDGDGSTDLQEFTALSSPEDVDWTPTKAKLIHRWSFNNDLTDSIASDTSSDDQHTNSPASVVDLSGANPTQTATDITIAGGASATSDYINLGSNLLNGRPVPISIELWATQVSVQNWARIWDFGSATTNAMIMSWTRGTNNSQQRNEWVATGYPTSTGDTNITNLYALGVKQHIVCVIEPGKGTAGGSLVTVYAAPSANTDLGASLISFSTSANLRNFVDSLNTLGHSQWTGDSTANATYDEFRIWEGALTSTERELYHDLGPDVIVSTDSDADGLEDSWEIANFGNITAQDGTGDPDGDGFNNEAEETAHTNPNNTAITPVDTDGDGMLDAWEVTYFGSVSARSDGSADYDGDLATNAQESAANTNPKSASTTAAAGNFPDSDSDGMNDAWEVKYFGSIATNDGTADTDGDGATDLAEFVALSSPMDVAWTPTTAKLIHQWTFNNTLADAVASGTGADAHTNSTATVVDVGANNTTLGTGDISLAGGTSTTSDYVSLGSNLLNGRAAPITIETWATPHGTGNFSRILDFGTGAGGTNFYMSWTRGTDVNQQRNEWNSTTYGVTTADTNITSLYTLNTKKHIVAVIEPGKGTAGTTLVSFYAADASATDLGAAFATMSTANNFRNFTDVSDFIGRSFYAGDAVANATYDEFRIYDGALTTTELEANHDAGPVPSDTYVTWATAAGLTGGDAATSADPDNDGITNLMEFYLNGTPTAFTAEPVSTVDATTLSLTFSRRDDAAAYMTTQVVEVSTDLVNWTPVSIPATSSTVSGITFVITDGSPADSVTASVAIGSDVKKFMRIRTVK